MGVTGFIGFIGLTGVYRACGFVGFEARHCGA